MADQLPLPSSPLHSKLNSITCELSCHPHSAAVFVQVPRTCTLTTYYRISAETSLQPWALPATGRAFTPAVAAILQYVHTGRSTNQTVKQWYLW